MSLFLERNQPMNKTIDTLLHRTSLRQFDSTPISDQDLKIILQAAKQAPTAGNMQMYSILNITDPDLKERLSISCDNQTFIKNGHILIFCNDMHKWNRAFDLFKIRKKEDKQTDEANFILSMQDALLAAQNAVIAAESLGIGSCYISRIMEYMDLHKELLHLPDHVFPCCMLVLGYYPKEYKKVSRNRYASEFMVFENTYTDLTDQQLKSMFNAGTTEETSTWLTTIFNQKLNSIFFKEMGESLRKAIASWKK